MAVSQVSPASTAPLPQTAGQSPSLLLLQPGAQQPSPLRHMVTGAVVHVAVQVPALFSVSVVQLLPSLQLVGQAPGWPVAMPVSQVSLESPTPLPQVGGGVVVVLVEVVVVVVVAAAFNDGTHSSRRWITVTSSGPNWLLMCAVVVPNAEPAFDDL